MPRKWMLWILTAALALPACAQVEIFDAARQGDLNRVKELLVSQHSVMDYDVYGSTLLHYAADGGQEEVAEYLILRGADVNAVNQDGFTPLHSCAMQGDGATAAALIARGAIVYTRDNNQMTPLHLCGLRNNVGVATVLVDNGADINDMTTTLWTPLRVAEYGKSADLIEWLKAHGAKQ